MTRRIKETPAYCVRCAKCGSVQCSLVPGDEFACGCGAWVKIPHAKKLPEGDSAWTGEAQRSRYFSSEWLAFTRARISCCSWRKKEWSAPKRSKSFTTISWPPLPQRTTIRARMSTISSSRLLSRCLPLLSPCFGESLASGGRAVKKADEFSRHRPERLREVIQILPVIRMNGYGAAHAAIPKKSFAVTAPRVFSAIVRMISALGVCFPLRMRLTLLRSNPISAAKSASLIWLSVR